MNRIKLIGGEFASNSEEKYLSKPGANYSFPKSINDFKLNYYQSGVDAMADIILEINKSTALKRVFFPTHYCQATIDLVRLKTAIIGYSEERYTKFSELDKLSGRDAVFVFYLNRFNKTLQDTAMKIVRNFGVTIIEDFVQCPLDIIKSVSYSFNSLRKFCSLDIAIAYLMQKSSDTVKKETKYLALREEAKKIKSEYLKSDNGSLEGIYLDLFRKAEKALSTRTVNQGNDREKRKLEKIDLIRIKKQRSINYLNLDKELGNVKEVKVLNGEYMFYMVCVKRRDELKQYLSSFMIFCPVHWNDSLDIGFRQKSLSLPVDHRMNKQDIRRLALAIKDFYSNADKNI